MKPNSRSPALYIVALFTLVAAVFAPGCVADTDDVDGVGVITQAATASNPDTYPFAMGNTNIQVGTISVWNDATNVYVKYDMLPGYELADAHLCISTSAFPWTPPGQCPYNAGTLPPDTTTWTFTVPFTDLGLEGQACDVLLHLQVHAAINNAATNSQVGSAYAGTFKGQVAYTISCDLPPESLGCTYTQGFWKTHPSAWPVSGLTIGGVYYTRSQLINFLKTAPRGDASIIMGHQLVATLLNVASGASVPPDVQAAIDAAQAWMAANKDADGTLPYGIRSTSEGLPNPAAWDQAIGLGAVLDLFNNGLVSDGPPHC